LGRAWWNLYIGCTFGLFLIFCSNDKWYQVTKHWYINPSSLYVFYSVLRMQYVQCVWKKCTHPLFTWLMLRHTGLSWVSTFVTSQMPTISVVLCGQQLTADLQFLFVCGWWGSCMSNSSLGFSIIAGNFGIHWGL
jgi:hypothetical protein